MTKRAVIDNCLVAPMLFTLVAFCVLAAVIQLDTGGIGDWPGFLTAACYGWLMATVACSLVTGLVILIETSHRLRAAYNSGALAPTQTRS